jgi:TolB-like protein/Flp pilus assembly protein TadD
MKRCPECKHTYSDEVKFCRLDGALLISDTESVDENAETVKLSPANETDTAGSRILPDHQSTPGADSATAAIQTNSDAQTAILDSNPNSGRTRELSRPKRRRTGTVIAALTALALIIGFGYYFLLRKNAGTIDSIAVLPFANANADPEMEYLSDGITENIINTLSRLPSLRVLPRSTVFRYKGKLDDPQQIGNELGVRAVLTGKIVQRGNQLQIQTELIDVASGNQLWGEQYNRPLEDVLNVQESIAREITAKLHLQLTGTEAQQLTKRYTENTEAYQLYLKGQFYWNKRTQQDLQKAIDYFRQAIALDPNYALAYAGLADAYFALSTTGATHHDLPSKARDAALKALSLDERLAEAHASLANILRGYDYDFSGAEREFKRALVLNPNYAEGHYRYGLALTCLGRHEEALAEYKRALELDPLSLVINRNYGESLLFARRYDESIAQLKKTLELDANFAQGHSSLATAYHVKGRYAESVEELARSTELNGNSERAALMRESFTKGGWEGYLRMMVGEGAIADLASPSYFAAVCYVALGEKDKAFIELNKAHEKREYRLTFLKVDPRLDPLRSDSRFNELLRKVGLS